MYVVDLMSIFILFVSACVLFECALSFHVSLKLEINLIQSSHFDIGLKDNNLQLKTLISGNLFHLKNFKFLSRVVVYPQRTSLFAQTNFNAYIFLAQPSVSLTSLTNFRRVKKMLKRCKKMLEW